MLEVADPDVLFNVNTPDDLLQAAGMLDLRASRAAPRDQLAEREVVGADARAAAAP